MASDITFKSLIHFELIFVVVQFNSFACGCLIFPMLFIEEIVPSPFYFWLLCHKLIDHINVGLFLGFLSCSIDLYLCFCASIILS